MAWATAKGFSFRSTAAFVTDAANDTGIIIDGGTGLAYAYPKTLTIGGESVVCGWVSITNVNTRDRNAAPGGGAKFAGIHFNGNTAKETFRVDLPATGSYTIKLAMGDYDNAQPANYRVLDNATAFITIASSTSAGDRFLDSAGTQTTSTAWADPGTTRTFGSTILFLELGDGTNAASGFVAYMQITQNSSFVSSFSKPLFPMSFF